ncbi:MAG: hypothetical protein CM15mP130_1630 [Verrucomicrobiota bacterium]|nr:MAG: hypothetical protein CM15mP130_1630 [Verrucomicrobiota bacterium]
MLPSELESLTSSLEDCRTFAGNDRPWRVAAFPTPEEETENRSSGAFPVHVIQFVQPAAVSLGQVPGLLHGQHHLGHFGVRHLIEGKLITVTRWERSIL